MFLEAQVAPWEETGISLKCFQEVVGCFQEVVGYLLFLTSINSEQLSSQSPLCQEATTHPQRTIIQGLKIGHVGSGAGLGLMSPDDLP
jgi:hypothetical protein